MATNRQINVSELDFNQIKSNLIEYMEAQPAPFSDYNFEGSAMSTVIDVLAYITHINAVNAHFALNETFIDTAQLRESVVSHAKLLGYTPHSTKPALAKINLFVNNPINVLDENNNNLPLTITRGTAFTTTINSVTYPFMASETTTINVNSDGNYVFEDLIIEQGQLKTTTYVYDDRGFEHYYLFDDAVNTNSVQVTIFESESSTQSEVYVPAGNVASLSNTTPVFFLEESREGLYEIKFGDGVIGKKPKNGNIISISYSVVGNSNVNGASQFALAGDINGNTNATVTVIDNASGYSKPETKDSIKFNAPLGYVAQNRAVTPDDYKAIIQNNWGDIETLTVWGGEDNIPPDYGKVYVSIKPLSGPFLSETDKATIIQNYLKPKNVVSITPVLVDPDYTYIKLDIHFKYNPNVSAVTSAGLANIIRTEIDTYKQDQLDAFGGVFRYSNLSKRIDDSHIAIISNVTRVQVYKEFTPALNTEKLYTFNFNQQLRDYDGSDSTIKSSEFTYMGHICYLEDYYDSEKEKYIVRVVTTDETILATNVGEVNRLTGHVSLTGFVPQSVIDTSGILKLFAKTASNDIKPSRNELITIDVNETTIQGEVDTMVTGGTTAGIDYNTVSS